MNRDTITAHGAIHRGPIDECDRCRSDPEGTVATYWARLHRTPKVLYEDTPRSIIATWIFLPAVIWLWSIGAPLWGGYWDGSFGPSLPHLGEYALLWFAGVGIASYIALSRRPDDGGQAATLVVAAGCLVYLILS